MSGVGPGRSRAKTEERMAAWLAERLGRDIEIVDIVVPGGNGFSAETVLVEVSAGEERLGFAIRFENPPERSLFMESRVAFQYSMITAVAATGAVPAPTPLGLEEDAAVLGAPFMVVGRVGGRAPPQSPNYNVGGWVFEESPETRAAMWRDAIEAMARLHSRPWRDGFAFLDRTDLGASGLDQILEATRRWYDWSRRDRTHALVEIALNRLAQDKPAISDDCALWGDAAVSNMLFSDGRVTAILDWEVAALGPGELDLAWWLFYQDYMSRGFGHQLLPGVPGKAETIAIYEAARGRAVRDFDYYDLLAHTRNTIMSIRSVNRQVKLGNIPDDTRAITDNPMSQLLAEQLGMAPPAVGEDYAAYLAVVTGTKRASLFATATG